MDPRRSAACAPARRRLGRGAGARPGTCGTRAGSGRQAVAELDATCGRRLDGVCRRHAWAGIAHPASSAAHGAIWTFGDPIRARLRQEPFRQPAHAGHLRGIGGSLVSELRQAAERDHRMDVRHHHSRCGLASSARRREGPYTGAHWLPEVAGRNSAYLLPHRRGSIPRAGIEQRAGVIRHHAEGTGCDCRRAARAQIQECTGKFSARSGRIQG